MNLINWGNSKKKTENLQWKLKVTKESHSSNSLKPKLVWTTLTEKGLHLNFLSKTVEAVRLPAPRDQELVVVEPLRSHQGSRHDRWAVKKLIWIFQVFRKSQVRCPSKQEALTENTLEAELILMAVSKLYQIYWNLDQNKIVQFTEKKVEELSKMNLWETL